jgi:hypothetical protein
MKNMRKLRVIDGTGHVVANNIIELMNVSRGTKNHDIVMSVPMSKVRVYDGCVIRIATDKSGAVAVTTKRGLRVETHIRMLPDAAMDALRRLWSSTRGGWVRGAQGKGWVEMSRKGEWTVCAR